MARMNEWMDSWASLSYHVWASGKLSVFVSFRWMVNNPGLRKTAEPKESIMQGILSRYFIQNSLSSSTTASQSSTFKYSFIHETIASLQETTTQMHSEPSHRLKRRTWERCKIWKDGPSEGTAAQKATFSEWLVNCTDQGKFRRRRKQFLFKRGETDGCTLVHDCL